MKWYAISGSWRNFNGEVEGDAEKAVGKIIKEGGGIASGGAIGVDYIATEIVLNEGQPTTQLKIFLPVRLEEFCAHYKKRAMEGVISDERAEMVCNQLIKIRKLSPSSIFDSTNYTRADEESYYARNTKIIESCDVLFAFQVNGSKGTQDAIDKARKLGKEVIVKKYIIK